LRGDVTGAALEAWTLLAALAAQTSRLRLGVIVTSNRIRPPAVLAKMAATVDVIAAGRLVFGIGAGGSATSDPGHAQLVHREYDAYGIDVVPAGEALAALAETCTLVKRLWTEEKPFDFDGRCYRLSGAVCEPKPVQRPHPPIMIGSGGERHGLRIVAEHADIWSSPTFTAADFRRKSAVLDDHCAAIGRDPAEITRSVQVFFTAEEPSSGTARHPGPAAARELLSEVGPAGLTYSVLAERAGVTRQTLYRHWPARPALLLGLILEGADGGYPEPGADPGAVAAAWLASLRDGLRDRGRRIAVLGDMLELGDFSQSEHTNLARAVGDSADLLYACGPWMKYLYDAVPSEQRGAYAPDSIALAPLVREAVRPGDVVLVKGSFGSRMHAIVQALEADHARNADAAETVAA